MNQKPDEQGRIIISKKVDVIEWERTVNSCKILPGKVSLDEYVNMALVRQNEYLENNLPYIDTKTKSKIIELVEDLRDRVDKNEEKDTHIAYLTKQLEIVTEELNAHKKS